VFSTLITCEDKLLAAPSNMSSTVSFTLMPVLSSFANA